MIVTFKSKSYANITMFGDIALRLLELMDFGCTVPGAISASDVPAALANLERGLSFISQEENDADEAEEDQPVISLNTRALPLIDLLKAAQFNNKEIRWE